jgi:hypothetical protein
MIPGSQLGSVYGSSVAPTVVPETKLQVEFGVSVVAFEQLLFKGAGGGVPDLTRTMELIIFVKQDHSDK